MNRKMKRVGSLLLSLVLCGTIAAACGNNSSNSGNSEAPGGSASTNTKADPGKPDISDKVELVWYLLGDPSADSQKVVDQWNKMLEKDLNTTVKLNFTTWSDWQTKYNLLLATGEKVDMIFASTWADFYKFSNQGAFMPLDDLLPTYAPDTWSKVPKQDWNEASVKGKIYAIPATYPEYTPDGLVYREDWRTELNLPEIKDLDSIEAYLDGVKKAKPNVTPINGKAWNEVFSLFKSYNGYEQIGGDSGVVVAKSYDTPRDIIAYPFTAEFEAWVKRMKTWADKGFWASDSLASQKEPGDAIKIGTGAVYLRNAPAAGGFITDLGKNKPDIKVGYFPFNRFHNYVMPTLSVNNAMAIPKGAANPERALMVLDKLRNDPKYYDLMTYGIEGTHYSIADDGKTVVTPPKGMEGKKDFKGYDIASWGWRVDSMSRVKQAAGWAGFDPLLEEFKAESKPNIFAPILLDYQPVKANQAALNQVFEQYGKPLMMGLVPDVDKALANFREQLTKAGVDKVVDYVKTEAIKYDDEKGIK
ncbi:extracellular solute-binding protein [Paenibacillus solisilvae]|uniref:Extracellular solute-binding protein n=1 Tax=Paenibacillus solisilvae TaxID=2486751 RepID=A0ABW0W0S7_9BACL